MPVFEVQGPDGKVYEVDAPDQDTAFNEFNKFRAEVPGPVAGTVRSIAQGMFGQGPNRLASGGDPQELARQQANEKAFASEHPYLSATGNVLGTSLDYLVPMLMGRSLGGRLANRIAPVRNVERAGAEAAQRELNTIRSGYTPTRNDPFIRPEIAIRTRAASERGMDEAKSANAIADKLKGRMQFGGGILGGAAGGAGEAYVHDRDPQTGALLGGAGGLGAGTMSAVTGKSIPGWMYAVGGAGAASALEHLGAPKWMYKPFEDFSLGTNPGWNINKK